MKLMKFSVILINERNTISMEKTGNMQNNLSKRDNNKVPAKDNIIMIIPVILLKDFLRVLELKIFLIFLVISLGVEPEEQELEVPNLKDKIIHPNYAYH